MPKATASILIALRCGGRWAFPLLQKEFRYLFFSISVIMKYWLLHSTSLLLQKSKSLSAWPYFSCNALRKVLNLARNSEPSSLVSTFLETAVIFSSPFSGENASTYASKSGCGFGAVFKTTLIPESFTTALLPSFFSACSLVIPYSKPNGL